MWMWMWMEVKKKTTGPVQYSKWRHINLCQAQQERKMENAE